MAKAVAEQYLLVVTDEREEILELIIMHNSAQLHCFGRLIVEWVIHPRRYKERKVCTLPFIFSVLYVLSYFLSFIFYLLSFIFYILSFIFYLLSFIFYLLSFIFYLLSFIFSALFFPLLPHFSF